MQFHPLAYIVKLNIEMSMADLIGKIARSRNGGIISEGTFGSTLNNQESNDFDNGFALHSRRRSTLRDNSISIPPKLGV